MKGDFSRNTFNPKKRYSSVRMQQGRVQLDADWNEQMDLIEHRHRTEAIDFIGATGAPSKNAGFAISVVDDSGTKNNLKISVGRYYVNGILCENCADVNFTAQEDYPSAVLPTNNGTYLVYLETWQHVLSAVDDPSIYEVALNGADTTVRTKTLAQVKLFSLGDNFTTLTPPDLNSYLNKELNVEKGKLIAKVDGTIANLQNQLYRIEIHQGSDNQTPSFKWSRNNAAVSARIDQVQLSNDTSSAIITLNPLTQLNQLSLNIGQWLEIITDEQQLRNDPGILVKLDTIEDYNLTVSGSINVDVKSLTNSILRCWDMTNTSGVIAITSDTAIALEDGLQVQFTAAGNYKTGDYWLIPTRVGNQIEWLIDANNQPAAQAPFGIDRSYAALAIVKCSNNQWSLQTDARYIFTSLADLQHSNAISIDPKAPAGSLSIDGQGNIKFKGNLATDAIERIVPFYVRGTGSNRTTEDNYTLIKLGDQVIVDSRIEQKPRGLYLCIINKIDYSYTVKRYDSYLDSNANTTDAEALATALNAMTSRQIGILASVDAWEAWFGNVDVNLLNALTRLGLYRAAAIKSNDNIIRRPYVAIFNPSDTGGDSTQAIEILQSTNPNSSYAELSGWLIDGSFAANGSSTSNALSYYVGGQPAVVVDENNVTTINNSISPTGAFSTTPEPNKVPVADAFGVINSEWVGNRWLPSFRLPPVYKDHGLLNFCAVYWQNKIYIMGGTIAQTNPWTLYGVMTNNVFVYDLTTNQWTQLHSMIKNRCGFAACILDNKIYVMGGYSQKINSSDPSIVQPIIPSSTDMECYDLTAGNNANWTNTNLPALNQGRVFPSAVTLEEKIYVIGGYDDGGTAGYLNDVEMYDPKKFPTQWIYSGMLNPPTGATPPSKLNNNRSDQAAVVMNDKIYVLGGWQAGSTTTDNASKNIEVYDPTSNVWTQYLINHSLPGYTRRYFGAVAIKGKIYALGGYDGALTFKNVEAFEVVDGVAIGTVVNQMPTPRTGLAVINVGNRIYAMGGTDTDIIEVYVCF